MLETIGRFDYGVSEFEVPGKGRYVTIGPEDKMFECHIRAEKVAVITMSKEPAKVGGHDI